MTTSLEEELKVNREEMDFEGELIAIKVEEEKNVKKKFPWEQEPEDDCYNQETEEDQ